MNKILFIPGLGEKPSDHRVLSKSLNIVNIDWNEPKLKAGKVDTLIGFSMGAVLACEHARKHKVKNLILCSMTPCQESLKDLIVERVIFLVGEKERWITGETYKIAETLKCPFEIHVIPGAGHRVTSLYREVLMDKVNSL